MAEKILFLFLLFKPKFLAQMRCVIALFFLISLPARADLPLISPRQLSPGSFYIWSYFSPEQNTPYSTEKYEVLKQAGPIITILMSTRIDANGEKGFRPTHKFVVDHRKCLAAHRDPRQKMNFLLDLYPVRADGSFAARSIPTEGLAFEEKFNCHARLRSGQWPDPYKTNFLTENTGWGEARLFQQQRTPKDQLVGFYFLDNPALQGVLYRKSFNPEATNHYEMRLVDFFQP